MSFQLDLVAVATACLSLYFIIRAKKTYFLDSGFFIGLATFAFIIYIGAAAFSDLTATFPLVYLDFVLVLIMGVSIGFAAYLLNGRDPRTPGAIPQLRKFLSRPPPAFMGYIGAVCGWTILGLVVQPWIPVKDVSTGTVYYYYQYPLWFIAVSAGLLASLIGFPVLSVYRQSLTVGQKTPSISMKIISISWAFFGLSLFAQIIGGFLLEVGQSVGLIVDSLLFVLISFALREPTILERIITSGESVREAIGSTSESDTIVLYNTESDRRRLVETFVKDGLATGRDVICHVTRSEVPFYRAILKMVDLPEPGKGGPSITIQPIETGSVLPLSGRTNVELVDSRRELIDLDELAVERCREIIESVTSNDSGRSRIGRIWALNVESAQSGVLDILTAKDPKSKVIDLAKQQDVFSTLLNLKHQDIFGSRLLLEYEPTSKYEDVVQKFVREFQANAESIAIFTSGGSPIHRLYAGQRNVRLFSFSTKTSTPARLSDEQVLLPERDTSLLLDAVDKLLQSNDGRRVGIVFEVFTYLILSLGFEKAYGVISSIVEMSESELATILVLVNYEALEPRVLNGVRGLFQSQLRFNSQTGLSVSRFEKSGHPNLGKTGEPEIDTSDPGRRIEA